MSVDLQEIPRRERGGPNVLVLSPTRELALQVSVTIFQGWNQGIQLSNTTKFIYPSLRTVVSLS